MDQNARNFFRPEDDAHIRELRHELHRHAELEFDLPETAAIVKGELTRLGIPFTQQYAPCSVVAYLNYDCEEPWKAVPTGQDGHVFTLAFRADMDALPIQEKSGVPFSSIHEGIMHACGHDTHTAMLLGAAGALKRAEQEGALKERIKLIFQPNEEGEETGSQVMIDHGVMEDVDFIYGQHIDMNHPTGSVLWIKGPAMAACHSYNITFHGKAAHATQPQLGHDAIAMALKACQDIYLMKTREIDPFKPHIISVGAIHGGAAHNIICDKVEIKISTRFFHEDVAELIDRRIRQICLDAAAELSGTVDIEDGASTYAVINDEAVADLAIRAAQKLFGKERLLPFPMEMGSEDFSCFQRVRPGAFFHLGGSCPEKGCVGVVHNEKVVIDEDAFLTGSLLITQIALDAE